MADVVNCPLPPAQGKVNAIDHEALVAAVWALKLILDRINEKDLIRQEMMSRAKSGRTANSGSDYQFSSG